MSNVERNQGRVVLPKELGEFLEYRNFDSFKDKFDVIGAAFKAQRDEVSPLHILDESQYHAFLTAVIEGNFVVDTGKYYVNIGEPINRDEFLFYEEETTASNDGLGATTKIYKWGTGSFKEASLLSFEELHSIVPKTYVSPEFILLENIAKEKWGISEEEEAPVAEDETSVIEEYDEPSPSEQLVEVDSSDFGARAADRVFEEDKRLNEVASFLK